MRPPEGQLFISQIIYEYGAPVERYWQGKTEELGETLVPVLFCPPQFLHRVNRARTRACGVRGRRLTALATVRLYIISWTWNGAIVYNVEFESLNCESHPCQGLLFNENMNMSAGKWGKERCVKVIWHNLNVVSTIPSFLQLTATKRKLTITCFATHFTIFSYC
jgi:hypothetical protein